MTEGNDDVSEASDVDACRGQRAFDLGDRRVRHRHLDFGYRDYRRVVDGVLLVAAVTSDEQRELVRAIKSGVVALRIITCCDFTDICARCRGSDRRRPGGIAGTVGRVAACGHCSRFAALLGGGVRSSNHCKKSSKHRERHSTDFYSPSP